MGVSRLLERDPPPGVVGKAIDLIGSFWGRDAD
jgi:hypothetical protein